MKLKILQLNIYKGKYIDNVISFVKKNRFDILQFQEVAGNKYSFGEINCFEILKKDLSLDGELCKDIILPNDPQSYMGNAIFYNDKIIVKDKTIVRFDKYLSPTSAEDTNWDKIPRSILNLSCLVDDKQIDLVTTHMVWGPTPKDSPDNIAHGVQLTNLVESLSKPYIVTGDFNIDQSATTVKNMNKLARNLVQEYNIQNTLNPRTHRVKELFPAGLAVDYIYVQKSIRVDSFNLVDSPDLSDHFGLMAEINF